MFHGYVSITPRKLRRREGEVAKSTRRFESNRNNIRQCENTGTEMADRWRVRRPHRTSRSYTGCLNSTKRPVLTRCFNELFPGLPDNARKRSRPRKTAFKPLALPSIFHDVNAIERSFQSCVRGSATATASFAKETTFAKRVFIASPFGEMQREFLEFPSFLFLLEYSRIFETDLRQFAIFCNYLLIHPLHRTTKCRWLDTVE